MENNSNIPKKCLDCRWFCKVEKIKDSNLPDRCFIYFNFHEIREAFKQCKGVSYVSNR
jgi:hypothetical protein